MPSELDEGAVVDDEFLGILAVRRRDCARALERMDSPGLKVYCRRRLLLAHGVRLLPKQNLRHGAALSELRSSHDQAALTAYI